MVDSHQPAAPVLASKLPSRPAPPACVDLQSTPLPQAGPYALSDSDDEARQAFQEGLAASALGQEWSFGPGADPEVGWAGDTTNREREREGIQRLRWVVSGRAGLGWVGLGCEHPTGSHASALLENSSRYLHSPVCSMRLLQGVAEALIEALRRAGGGTVVMCDSEASLGTQFQPGAMLLLLQQQQTGHAPSAAGGSDCTASHVQWPASAYPARRASRACLCVTA